MTTLLFAGGGTGGHVFPLLAVADAVRVLAPDVELVFVGTERGLETKLVPERGYPLELLRVTPIRGGGVAGAVRGAFLAAKAIPDARALVRRLSPRAVFSIGGYAAGPVSLAARSLGVPLTLMEPNSAVGLANLWVAPFVDRAYLAFPESARRFRRARVLVTGVPIRVGFRPVAFTPSGEPSVLVLGGSQGALSLNEAVPRALAALTRKVRVVHQCGAGKDAAVRARYAELGFGERARVVPFIDDVPSALAEADLVVGRSGAGAVAEICAVGRPSLFIPYPFAGDHQRHNAESLVRAGAAVSVASADATVPHLSAVLDGLFGNLAVLATMAERASALGRPDAALVIARDLLALAGLEDPAKEAARSSDDSPPPGPVNGRHAGSREGDH